MDTDARADFDREFKQFLAELRPEADIDRLPPHADLFDAGVFDSFTVARVILFLEQLRGEPIDLERATIEAFSTADNIYVNFVS